MVVSREIIGFWRLMGITPQQVNKECVDAVRREYPQLFEPCPDMDMDMDMEMDEDKLLTVKQVIYNGPATIVIWGNGEKTVAKCKPGEKYSKAAGLMACLCKRLMGKEWLYEILNEWLPDEQAGPETTSKSA